MHKLLHIFLILALVYGCSEIFASEKIVLESRLEGTNVTAVAPSGWWVDPRAYSTIPSVFFMQAHPTNKPYYISRAELVVRAVNPERKVNTLSVYIKDLQSNAKSVKVFHFSIGQRRGIVYVSKFYRTIDFMGGTGRTDTMIAETVLLQDGNRLYSCELSTKPEDYGSFKGTAAKLCAALRFDPETKSSQK